LATLFAPAQESAVHCKRFAENPVIEHNTFSPNYWGLCADFYHPPGFIGLKMQSRWPIKVLEISSFDIFQKNLKKVVTSIGAAVSWL
jgi:hypothetical protein